MNRSIVRIKKTQLLGDDSLSILRAAKIIRTGGLVAFPTETVYGLGASAYDTAAVHKIFAAKGRPYDNPLIVHIAELIQLESVAVNIGDTAYKLAQQFWPGPLSIVLERSDNVPSIVSAGLKTVAVRMPAHSTALELIKRSGVPLAAPSANRAGSPSPTSSKHVLEDLADTIDAVIMGGTCRIGVESTVLDITGNKPVILRPGGVSREDLESFLGQKVLVANKTYSTDIPSSPGMKYRHYSPHASLILVTGQKERRSKAIKAISSHYHQQGFKVAFLNQIIDEYLHCQADAIQVARMLFRIFRIMDYYQIDLILAEEINTAGLGLAVMNRIRKAAVRIIRA